MQELETGWIKTGRQSEVICNIVQKQNNNGPDRGRWSHIQTLCTACPTRAHCHSGLVSLWQPQPLTQDLDCLEEKETVTNVEIITELPSFLLHTLYSQLQAVLSVKYDSGTLCCS